MKKPTYAELEAQLRELQEALRIWDAYDLALRDGRSEDAAVFYEQMQELRAALVPANEETAE